MSVSFKPDPGAKAVDAFTLSWRGTRFYAFPPFCVIPKVLQNSCRDRTKGVVVVPLILAKSTMVSTDSKDADKLPNASISEEESVKSTTKPSRGTSTSKTATEYLRSIRSRFRRTGFSKQATYIMCSSWRTEPPKRYACYVAKWRRYAHSRHIDSISPSISEAVNILAHLHKSGLGYSAICVARSALSSYLNIADVVDFGQHKTDAL